jgi:hypothetical protein
MGVEPQVSVTGDPISPLGDIGKIVTVDVLGTPGLDCDFTNIADAAAFLRSLPGKRGGIIGLMGSQTHNVNTIIDIRGMKFVFIGAGVAVISAQTGGLLQSSGNEFIGMQIDVLAGFTNPYAGFYFIDIIENGGLSFDRTTLNIATGKFLVGSSVGGTRVRCRFRNGGQQLQQGIVFDPAATFALFEVMIWGTNNFGSIQFGARPVTADGFARYDTTGQITGIPIAELTVAPGENIQSRLDSLAAVGGGLCLVLSGIHLRTEPCYLIGNNIKMQGSGDGTVIRALAGTWNAAYTQGGTGGGGAPSRYQDSVVCIGRSHNGLSEVIVEGCEVQDLVVESSVSIHGFYIYGGTDNRFEGCTARALDQLIYPGSWAAVGFMITDSYSLPAERCVIDDCVVESDGTSHWYCDAYHMEGGPPAGGFSGFYGNGNRVYDSSIIECSASSAFQTIYSLSKCTDSTCYICTGRNCPKDGTGNGITLGVFNCNKCAFIDVTGVNPAVATNIGAWIQDTVLTDFIDCFIAGNPTGPVRFGSGIYVVNSQQNLIIQNVLEYCTTGINITDAASTDNIIGPNTFNNVITNIVDANGLNKFMVKAQYGSGNPNGVVSAKFGDEFFDSGTSTWYKQSTYPLGTTWVVI